VPEKRRAQGEIDGRAILFDWAMPIRNKRRGTGKKINPCNRIKKPG